MRLIRDGEKGGAGGVWRWGKREIIYLSLHCHHQNVTTRLYTDRYAAVTTRMTSALRWAAMRTVLMFHNCEGQSHKTVSTDHNV